MLRGVLCKLEPDVRSRCGRAASLSPGRIRGDLLEEFEAVPAQGRQAAGSVHDSFPAGKGQCAPIFFVHQNLTNLLTWRSLERLHDLVRIGGWRLAA
jgi:hypothetical protein